MRARSHTLIVCDHDHGESSRLSFREKVKNARASFRVEVPSRFICEQDPRTIHQRTSDGDALAFAARQLGRSMRQAMRKPADFEEFRCTITKDAFVCQPREARNPDKPRQHGVFKHREFGQKVIELKDETDIAVSIGILAAGAECTKIMP
jgi:hypothetical protein